MVDGDVAEKVPVTAARSLGEQPVVGVDVSNPVRAHKPRNSFEVMLMAGEASIMRLKALALERCDYVLSLVPEKQIDTFDYSQASNVYHLGVERTRAALDDLRRLLNKRPGGLLGWLKQIPGDGKGQR